MKQSKKAYLVSGRDILEVSTKLAEGRVQVTFDGEQWETSTRVRGNRHMLQNRKGAWIRAEVTTTNEGTWISLDGETVFVPLQNRKPRGGAALAGGGPVSPMPGVVIRVDVEEGQAVEEGDVLAVVEAMKIE